MRLDMKFNAIEPLKCMSHYNIVMDEYRHKKKNVERAGEMKIMKITFFFSRASWDCEAVLSQVRYLYIYGIHIYGCHNIWIKQSIILNIPNYLLC